MLMVNHMAYSEERTDLISKTQCSTVPLGCLRMFVAFKVAGRAKSPGGDSYTSLCLCSSEQMLTQHTLIATGLPVQMRMLKSFWQTSIKSINSATIVYIINIRIDVLHQISIFCKHIKIVMLLDQAVFVS